MSRTYFNDSSQIWRNTFWETRISRYGPLEVESYKHGRKGVLVLIGSKINGEILNYVEEATRRTHRLLHGKVVEGALKLSRVMKQAAQSNMSARVKFQEMGLMDSKSDTGFLRYFDVMHAHASEARSILPQTSRPCRRRATACLFQVVYQPF